MSKLVAIVVGFIGAFLLWAAICIYYGAVLSMTHPVDWVAVYQIALLLGPAVGLFGALAGDSVARR